jgi:cysteine-rich repeat protein
MTDLETRCLGWAMALLSVSCSVFDEKLIPPDFRVTDECKQDAVPVASSNDYLEVDLTDFKSDQTELPVCLESARAQGKDFFLAVSMKEGDRWHFHAKAAADLDPALYILTGCDDVSRNCTDGTFAVNNCGIGGDEHLTFVPKMSQTYYVGVDYVGTAEVPSAGSNVEVVAVRAVCGNKVKEHPEFCDDGNMDPNDGCDQCRQALTRGDADTNEDVSKNDGPLDATILVLDAGQLATLTAPYTFRVNGTLGDLKSNCDFDFYEFDLSGAPPLTKVTAVLDGTPALCGHADLRMLEPNSSFPFTPGAARPDCPITSTMMLEPGKHLVRVNSLNSVMPALPLDDLGDKGYTLTLTFARP